MFGWKADFQTFESDLKEDGFWIVFMVSFLPIPIQVATFGSCALDFSFGLFVLAIALSRGLRFFGIAVLVWWLGPRLDQYMIDLSPTTKLVGIALFCAVIYAAFKFLPF